MARARNIKPAFFNNDELAEIEPLGRLLFIGLWTIADFKGDLEWREKRIKAQLLPYDNCDVKKVAINLDKSGFIRFYSDNDKIYLNISNFSKHQNPHKNERIKGSEIPAFSESMRQVVDLTNITINRDKNGTAQDKTEVNHADSLIPITDSLNLIPDSLKPITEEQKPSAKANEPFLIFSYWKEVMKKNDSAKFGAKRLKAVKDRLKEGYTVDEIKQAIYGCSITPHNIGQNDQGKRFDCLELICRFGTNIERFTGNAQQAAPKQYSAVTERNINNIKNTELF